MIGSTLENKSTRTAQSLRGSCSRRVHKIVCLADDKAYIMVMLLTSENIHHKLLSLIFPSEYLLNEFLLVE